MQSARRRRTSTVYVSDPALPPLFSRAQARAAGLTDRQVSHRLALGLWAARHRGLLRVVPAQPVGRDRDARERIIAAAQAVRGRELAISHASAACMYGLPAPLGGWPEPTLTAAAGRTRRRGGVHVLVAPLREADVRRIGTLPVTGAARTVVDCLRTLPDRDALAIADAALRAGLPEAELLAEISRQAGWPGIVGARELAGLADGRRETPLESWSALCFHRGAVPRPLWQVDILTPSAVFCGRVDSWWAEGLAGEADGKAKYALAAAQRRGGHLQQLLEVLGSERSRETAIRRTGAEVARWGATDVLRRAPSEQLCAHLRRQLRRVGSADEFIGTAVLPVMRTPGTR